MARKAGYFAKALMYSALRVPHLNHLPSRFGACFVDGKFLGAGLTMAVVDNCLCIRELLNILAANGEQGEYGND